MSLTVGLFRDLWTSSTSQQNSPTHKESAPERAAVGAEVGDDERMIDIKAKLAALQVLKHTSILPLLPPCLVELAGKCTSKKIVHV